MGQGWKTHGAHPEDSTQTLNTAVHVLSLREEAANLWEEEAERGRKHLEEGRPASRGFGHAHVAPAQHGGCLSDVQRQQAWPGIFVSVIDSAGSHPTNGAC